MPGICLLKNSSNQTLREKKGAKRKKHSGCKGAHNHAHQSTIFPSGGKREGNEATYHATLRSCLYKKEVFALALRFPVYRWSMVLYKKNCRHGKIFVRTCRFRNIKYYLGVSGRVRHACREGTSSQLFRQIGLEFLCSPSHCDSSLPAAKRIWWSTVNFVCRIRPMILVPIFAHVFAGTSCCNAIIMFHQPKVA